MKMTCTRRIFDIQEGRKNNVLHNLKKEQKVSVGINEGEERRQSEISERQLAKNALNKAKIQPGPVDNDQFFPVKNYLLLETPVREVAFIKSSV